MTPDPSKPIDPALLDPLLRIQKVIDSAEQLKVSNQVPLIRYFRSLMEIERMAKAYIDERNLERAFVLLYRFCWFAVSELRRHQDYESHESEEKRLVTNMLSPTLALAEQVKNELRKVYEEQAAYYRFEETQRELRKNDFVAWVEARSIATEKSAELLRVAEEATNRAGMQMGHVQPLQPTPDDEPMRDPKVATADIRLGDVSANPLLETARALSPVKPPGSAGSAFRPINPGQRLAETHSFSFATEYPSIGVSTVVGQKVAPSFSRATKPEAAPEVAAFNKRMAVAGDLVEKFLQHASENTLNNIETCGILGGTAVRERFIVSHVVIPKQTGTANGCIAEGDEDVFPKVCFMVAKHYLEVSQVLDEADLLSLGWIHTHPSQTAFLSSVDLHTHFSYQKMMSESIAIVCSPAHNEVGTFVLTPEGMNAIEACDLRGFHPHPETVGDLFATATHVHYTGSISANVIDIRKIGRTFIIITIGLF